MDIEIVDFVEGAQKATDTVVIIDVFRAFSVACYLFDQGADKIIAAGAIEDALELSRVYPEAILIGERQGKKIRGFDFGNSPSEVEHVDFTGKTIIHTTHAGTQGIVNATKACEILTGSLVNARATSRYVRSKAAHRVFLVRMGLHAESRTDEDDLCAAYLKALLLDEDFDVEGIPVVLGKSSCSDRFFDPEKPWSPEADFHMCVDVDRFGFAIRATRVEGGLTSLTKVRV